jgi:CDP-diacylglycerol---glycerol-3-phosphate 3-phosphatidyltransferase
MALIPRWVENSFNKVLLPLVYLLKIFRLSPNTISTIGIIPSIVAAFFLASGWFVTGGIFILLGGIFDLIDGPLARMTNRTTKFGALYDSTLDRFAELAMYTGIGYFYVFQGMHLASLLVVIAASGSIMVSYVRARAESHGFTCNVGWMRRGERIVLLGGAALFSFFPQPFDSLVIGLLKVIPFNITYYYPPMPLTLAIAIIAFATPVTVAQRVFEVWKQTKYERSTLKQTSTQETPGVSHQKNMEIQ